MDFTNIEPLYITTPNIKKDKFIRKFNYVTEELEKHRVILDSWREAEFIIHKTLLEGCDEEDKNTKLIFARNVYATIEMLMWYIDIVEDAYIEIAAEGKREGFIK